MKRILSMMLVVMMVLSMTACGSKEQSKEKHVDKVTFPLEEPVTFTFMVKGTESVSFAEDMANNALWKRLEEETNVHIEFQFLGDTPTEKLSLLVNGDSYGDVLWGGPIVNSTEASKYIAAGIFVDLQEYLTEELMPNFMDELEVNPAIMNSITASDGNVYTMPKITGLEGQYLESPIYVNKAWLDKVGLGIPTTLDEFTNMLKAFRDKDPNGNGIADEIPYICATSQTDAHTEALLGMWGLSTKDGTNDSFVQVVDGKVRFVPATEEYKEAVTYLAMLYDEGLMWSEAFTADNSAFLAKFTSETPVVGCFTKTEPGETAYKDDYVVIAPPKVEGYDACWFYHPAFNGSSNQFFVTDKCENVNVLMAWLDSFYDVAVTMEALYGSEESGRIKINDEGKYEVVELDDATKEKLNRESPTLSSLLGNFVCSISTKDFVENVVLSEQQVNLQSNYEVYKDYITTEPWPRPYISPDDAYDASTYSTDIMYEVQTRRAKWITGKGDIDKEWSDYLKQLDTHGLEKFVEIMQRAYDANQGK